MRAGGDLSHFNPTARTTVHVGTWGSHYKSWQSFRSQGKYLLIKYEDLIANKEQNLKKVLFVKTFYEKKWIELGKTIKYLGFKIHPKRI